MTTFPGALERAVSAVPEPLRPEVGEIAEALEADAELARLLAGREAEAVRVWAVSPFVRALCLRVPGLLEGLLRSGELHRACTEGEMRARVATALEGAGTEAEVMRGLRRVRAREMLRIAWRDLSALAELSETLRDLSDLAEACTDLALDRAYAQACERYGVPRDAQGEPQRLVVLGMGKLGGRELNFSSDIDLMFAYPAKGHTDGRRALDNGEFFSRVGQALVRLLGEHTADGFVFRVDMRLRPFGSASPLALSFGAMEDYYQRHGRDWERYALIKARVIAGDRAAGACLMARLRPFVYRRYLDFGAFEALREMKALINAEVQRKGLGDNVKLGAGGIREVEFIGQAFQLIRGGRDPELQVRGIREVLTRLGAKGLMPQYAVKRLLAAYAFLRTTENRLQMMRDQQTHVLPTDTVDQVRLAHAMGFTDWQGFSHRLEAHRLDVREEFDRVFAAPQLATEGDQEAAALIALWQGSLDGDRARVLLERLGFRRPEAVSTLLGRYREGRGYRLADPIGRERLRRLMPLLIAAVARTPEPDAVLPRLLAVVEAIAQRSVYISLLLEHPAALSQLVRLSAASPWIAEFVARHPILLDELLDPRTLYAPIDRSGLARALESDLAQVDAQDLEEFMERLRHFKNVQMLRVAAADVTGVLPVAEVSSQLTWLAEVILEAVFASVWAQFATRYGTPRCVVEGHRREVGFAIIAYGKLGGMELGYGSDLDIVFLHDSQGHQQLTEGPKSVENSVFFTRLGQRVIHILTAYTPGGSLYEVDARLRPSGRSGLLVSGIQAFGAYQRHEAWTWEHQALVRARFVVGDLHVGEAFDAIRREILTRPRDPEALRRDVREMRERMWQEHGAGSSGRFDIKRDPGGMTDIEFMVQYAVLAHAHAHPELCRHTDNVHILEDLGHSGLMPVADVGALQEIYRVYRNRVHALSLQDSPALVDAEEYRTERETVRRLWRGLLGA